MWCTVFLDVCRNKPIPKSFQTRLVVKRKIHRNHVHNVDYSATEMKSMLLSGHSLLPTKQIKKERAFSCTGPLRDIIMKNTG